MKNLKIKILLICIIALAITACNNDQPKEESVVDQIVEQSKAKKIEQKKANEVPKELIVDNTTITYYSKYSFVKDENKSQDIKSENPLIVNSEYYDQNISNLKGNIVLSYSKYSVKPNLDGAIDGVFNAVKNNPIAKITDLNKKDVSSQYGYPATLASGKIKLSQNGETFDGNFQHLFIIKGNELFMLQAFTGLKEEAKEVEKTYNSISLK